MCIFYPSRHETASHEKYNSKERITPSHCFIVSLLYFISGIQENLVYLNEENMPLKRVRINPGYNTFVSLVFFLVWFLFQLLQWFR